MRVSGWVEKRHDCRQQALPEFLATKMLNEGSSGDMYENKGGVSRMFGVRRLIMCVSGWEENVAVADNKPRRRFDHQDAK